MRHSIKNHHLYRWGFCQVLYFWPFFIVAGRLVVRAVLNLWNMVEPSVN